jgi:hypothetical protein
MRVIKFRRGGKNLKWIARDIDTYLSAKEYVDTAVIPIHSLSLGEEMKHSAEAVEFITLLSSQLERQFTGRLVLFPSFTYLKNKPLELVINELKDWEDNIIHSNFKHIFYITSGFDWKTMEQHLAGSVISIPSLPLDQMDDSQKKSIIDSQVKQLLTLFTQRWQENS